MKEFTEEERYNYNLTENSLVIDAGAYHGHFSKRIWDKYRCRVIALEPSEEFFKKSLETLKETGVYLLQCGVSDHTESVQFGIANDSTGRFKDSTQIENVSLMDVLSFVNGVRQVDLLKLNIEGGEYAVIRRLVETGLIKRIVNLQVQFHECVENSVRMVESISEELSKTHHLTFNAGPYIWQNWEINQ